MITITEAAKAKVLELMKSENQEGQALRLGIRSRAGGAFQYALRFEAEEGKSPHDHIVDAGGFRIFIDPKSAESLAGAAMDYVEDATGSGFKIDNPNPLWNDPTSMAVQRVLDEAVNPGVASHGGYVVLLEVRDGIAYVQLGGGCHGCGMANVTLKQGVEVAIKEAVPEIREVVDTTDHAGGTNPYYRPS